MPYLHSFSCTFIFIYSWFFTLSSFSIGHFTLFLCSFDHFAYSNFSSSNSRSIFLLCRISLGPYLSPSLSLPFPSSVLLSFLPLSLSKLHLPFYLSLLSEKLREISFFPFSSVGPFNCNMSE